VTVAPPVEDLRRAVSAGAERATDHYAIDGIRPRVAFQPPDQQETAALLRAAYEAGLALVPQGARTQLTLGRPLERYDVALDTTALDRLVEYEPADLTVSVEAGMSLARLQSTLGEHGQYLPIDAPPNDGVTIGGLLATARPGAWRGHLPAARDLLLGATFALPDGALASSGGRVVKNVSGYDLHRLQTGALGAFGVITQASFKVAPLPAAVRTLVLPCRDLVDAASLALALWDAVLATRALSVLSADAAAMAGLDGDPGVLIELAGVEGAVERSTREVRSQSTAARDAGSDAWARLRDRGGSAEATELRLGVPPTEVASAISAASESGLVAWGNVASGSVIAITEDEVAASTVSGLREVAKEAGGFLQIEAAPAELRRAIDPFAAEELDLVRSLKQQFDPTGTLNPGRWAEGV
jgi:glycolate oxidase FAD binding subunit